MAISLNKNYVPMDRYLAVVEHDSGTLVVSAGPGTGKTFSLIRRIERLIDSGIDPSQIYYLTFVNSIVDAFKADIGKPKAQGGLGIDAEGLGIHISTLHSLAFKIVKAYSKELGLSSYLEVIDLSPKPQSILSQIFVSDLFEYSKKLKIIFNKNTFDQLLGKVTETWRKNVQQHTDDCKKFEELAKLFCMKYSVCSWDQLVLLAIKALSNFGLPSWLQGAQHFMIDEYQDFNPAEQRFLELITEPSDSVIIVGDPDQSIYSGRSASPQGLIDLFDRDDVKCVNFVYCRRCSKKVLVAANNMLKFMDAAGYERKELQLLRDEDGGFNIVQHKSCKTEIEYLSDILKSLDESTRAEAIIMLPTKRVAEYYLKKLRERGVVCEAKITDTTSELLRSVLRLVVLRNHPFLERVLLSLFPSLDRKYRNHVLSIFLNINIVFRKALDTASIDQNWQKPLKDSLSSYISTIEKLVSGHVDSIIAGFTDLNLNISKDVIISLLEGDEDLSVMERIKSSLMTDDQEPKEIIKTKTSVEVITMHSSKGLSKKLVIIPAFDEKLLPGRYSGERLAEINRLLYVAVTRARDQIIITFPKTRARGDPLNYGDRPKLSSYADILLPT